MNEGLCGTLVMPTLKEIQHKFQLITNSRKNPEELFGKKKTFKDKLEMQQKTTNNFQTRHFSSAHTRQNKPDTCRNRRADHDGWLPSEASRNSFSQSRVFYQTLKKNSLKISLLEILQINTLAAFSFFFWTFPISFSFSLSVFFPPFPNLWRENTLSNSITGENPRISCPLKFENTVYLPLSLFNARTHCLFHSQEQLT